MVSILELKHPYIPHLVDILVIICNFALTKFFVVQFTQTFNHYEYKN